MCKSKGYKISMLKLKNMYVKQKGKIYLLSAGTIEKEYKEINQKLINNKD